MKMYLNLDQFRATVFVAMLMLTPALHAQTESNIEFLTTLEKAEVQYFQDQATLPNYLMPTTWSMTKGPDRRVSSAATGLEMVALCIADSHGWIDRETAIGRVTKILTLVAKLQMKHPETMGLMYQYMNRDGSRYRTSKVGTDDGCKLILSALTARQYFHDPVITKLVNQIYSAVDWNVWVYPKICLSGQITDRPDEPTKLEAPHP